MFAVTSVSPVSPLATPAASTLAQASVDTVTTRLTTQAASAPQEDLGSADDRHASQGADTVDIGSGAAEETLDSYNIVRFKPSDAGKPDPGARPAAVTIPQEAPAYQAYQAAAARPATLAPAPQFVTAG